MRLCLALAALLFVHVASAAEEEPAQRDTRPRASDTLKPPKKAASSSPITDRFALRLLYWPSAVTTDLRIDPGTGPLGTEVDAEDDLGLDDKSSEARAEMVIRLRQKNRLRVDYVKIARTGDQIIERTINFGDQTFNVNERALSSLEWRNLTLTYTRSLIYTSRFEVGAGVGFSILEARARGTVPARNVDEHQEAVGAFPTIALDGTWRISKRWALSLRGQRFTASVDEFKGSLADYHGDIQYRWRENFAIGLGYTKLHTLVDVGQDDTNPGDSDLTGRFDQRMSGPEIFLRASF